VLTPEQEAQLRRVETAQRQLLTFRHLAKCRRIAGLRGELEQHAGVVQVLRNRL
jgi:hypothetical protein